MGDVGKHGFDHGHALTIDMFTFVGVDAVFHPVRIVRFPCGALDDEGDLPAMAFAGAGGVRVAQAVLFSVTGTVFGQAAFEEEFGMSIVIDAFTA